MTATATAPRTFTNITDFLTNAVPGDVFTENSATSRSITTNVFVERTEGRREGEIGGNVRVITTSHNKDRKTITSASYINPTHARGGFVSVMIAVGGEYTPLGGTYTARYSAKTLTAQHEAALEAAKGHGWIA